MSVIDDDIAKGKRRRKWLALSSGVALTIIVAVYFSWLFLTKGHSFTVVPEQAAKAPAFEVIEGTGFFVDNKLYLFGGSATANVSAPKFHSSEVVINDDSPGNIEVELTPLPATVTVTTDPALDNVRWSVNGERSAEASSFDGELAAGHYTITAAHPSYESASISFQAEIAEAIDKSIKLTPINGSLTIASTPAGAQVSIDGELLGNTPLNIERAGGEYQVEVSLEGYEPVTDSVRITQRRPDPDRNYQLQPRQASLSVELTPADGVLLINGKTATNPASVDANRTHTVRYQKQGYLPRSQQVSLAAGEKGQLRFKLEAEMGTVTFQANETADVFVNGSKLGTTPVTTDLQALPTTIEFKKQGYRSVKKSVTPSADKTSLVAAEMLTEFDARRRDGQPLFVETLDISMAKVSPRAFTMGSAPGEKDRKSNEHQFKVDFSRDIWVSRHEITQTQYKAFSQQGVDSKMPVTDVTWEQAAKYTNWLSEQEGLMPFYQVRDGRVVGVDKAARGYRLLSEAEWEFIARINRRASPTTFVWGSQEYLRDKQGNFADVSRKGQQTFILADYSDGFAGAAPVGSFKPERSGFYDLDGNVREWVHDRYTVAPPDDNRTHLDYLGSATGTKHVVKGASFKTGRLKNIRASIRHGESGKADDIGFRIARYHQRSDRSK
ncbi:MAG: SUMF1/EgtB/PvdO family nonheme iron enzyme [Pseudomonadota bacterium]